MKKVLLTSAAVLAASAASAADFSPYASGKLNAGLTQIVDTLTIGGSSVIVKSDRQLLGGGAAAAGAAYGINDMFAVRAEGELAFDYVSASGGSALVPSVGANVYLDWKATKALAPYVGFGLGYGWTGMDNGDGYEWKAGDESLSGMNYSFMAGVGFAMSKNLSLDFGLRYKVQDYMSTETSFPVNMEMELSWETYSVQLGARYAF